MTIVTTVVSVDRRYLDKKPKRWLLQTYEHLTRRKLPIEEWNALMTKLQSELADMVWEVWRNLPEKPEPVAGEDIKEGDAVVLRNGKWWKA